MGYRWVIEKDYISESFGNVGVYNHVGFLSDHPDHIELFRMYDDDDILYYEGTLCFDNQEEDRNPEVWFAPLDDYGMPNDGCTRIRILNTVTGKWDLV